MFIEILFKMLLFKGGVLIYAEHCVCIYTHTVLSVNEYIYAYIYIYIYISGGPLYISAALTRDSYRR